MRDREWRLNNLYYIKDDDGNFVKFKLTQAQTRMLNDKSNRTILLKARQLGSSTFWTIFALDAALFRKGLKIAIVADTKENAEKLLREKIMVAYDRLPADVKSANPITDANASRVFFPRTSSEINCSVNTVGGTIQMLIVTEFGPTCASNPARADSIVRSFESVPASGLLVIESTARGKGGEYHRLCDAVITKQTDYWSMLFFPWFDEEKYRADPSKVSLADSELRYFTDLKLNHGIELDEEQKAWYVQKLRTMGRDRMLQEYPSTPEEPFEESLRGAYYAEQMRDLKVGGRICDVPIEKTYPVETWWDISRGGADAMAIWFVQKVGLEYRAINYYEASGEGYAHYARYLAQFAEEHDIRYDKHWAPHDGSHSLIGLNQVHRQLDLAQQAGIRWEIVPRTRDLLNDIEVVRRALPLFYIDRRRCEKGILHLEQYRKQWDEVRGVFRDQPLHNAASHGADALRTGIIAQEQARRQSSGMARQVVTGGRWAV